MVRIIDFSLVFSIVVLCGVHSSPTIEPVTPVVKVGSNPSSFQQFVSIICDIFDAALESVEIRWMLPNGTYISIADNSPDRFSIENLPDNMNRNRTQLFINALSYVDNGTYSCEVREKGSINGSWSTANIDLVLLVHLTATSSSPVTVSQYNNTTSVELSCDMAGFIPENTALKWYKDQKLVTEDDRVSVTYTNGSRSSSIGLKKISKSIESFLLFKPPRSEDSGEYECRISNYEHLPNQTIVLIVDQELISKVTTNIKDDVRWRDMEGYVKDNTRQRNIMDSIKDDIKRRDVMDSILDELGSAFSISEDNLDNVLPTTTPMSIITTTLVTMTTPLATTSSIQHSNTRLLSAYTTQFVTMTTVGTPQPRGTLPPFRNDSFNKNTIQLFFIFILVSIMFILLIAMGLTLLVGICLYRRTSYIGMVRKPLISSSKSKATKDSEELCMSSPPYTGKFEVVRPNTPHSITGPTAEASTFGFPKIVISDSTHHPQELISYDVPSSLLPLTPAPAQVTPRNSTRVSIHPPETTADHGSEDYDDVDEDDLESTDYIEPFDSLNQINDSSWYTFSLTDHPIEVPPTPPERVESMRPAISDDEHIYTEPLEPSMLSDNLGYSPPGRGLPYAPIYDISSPSKKSLRNLYHAPPDSVRIIQELGRGHFGNVYLAATVGISLKNLRLSDDADSSRSLLVAIKQLKPNADSNLIESFDKEIWFMSQLHHPNVARLLAVSDGGTPFIMMEYMENGDLNEFLRKQQIKPDTAQFLEDNEVTPLILLYISVQIASGMKYLASRKFVHRDLATRNCLVGREFVTKISDFGMSRNIYETSYYRVGSQLILPIRWMASETFYGKFSVKSDGWSFGVTLWEVFTLCRCVPYTGLSDDQVIADALKGEDRQVLSKPFDCPEEVYDVMKRCFEPRIFLRADFEEIYARLFVVYSKLGQMNKTDPI